MSRQVDDILDVLAGHGLAARRPKASQRLRFPLSSRQAPAGPSPWASSTTNPSRPQILIQICPTSTVNCLPTATARRSDLLRPQRAIIKTVMVFVSHAHRDRDAVATVLQRVQSAANAAWAPVPQLPESIRWREEFDQLLETCHAILVVVSRHSAASEHCKWELERAIEAGLTVWVWILDGELWHPALAAGTTLRVSPDDLPERWGATQPLKADG